MAEIPKEMLRAQTNVILLNVLKQGDNYVYGIIKQVKEASNGENTVHPQARGLAIPDSRNHRRSHQRSRRCNRTRRPLSGLSIR